MVAEAGNVLVWAIWIGAAIAFLASGIAVVTFASPFYSALSLIVNLASLAVMYLLLAAEFVAAAQVLVYAGAVIIMFLFVIAYLGGRAETPWAGGPRLQSVGAIVAAAAIAVEVIVVIALQATDRLASVEEVSDFFGSPRQVGQLFVTDHLLAFEATSIVLLVAAVGGVVLGLPAGRRGDDPETTEP